MEIKTAGGFLEKCLGSPLLKKEGVTIFYRGVNQRVTENPHIPSLYYPPHRYYEHENAILKEVISVFPDLMLAQKLTVEKLFLLRHYGFPTRLLDISRNPLVDLFFACFADKGQEHLNGKDGVVYIYAVPTPEIKYSDSDTVTMLANICKTRSDFPGERWDHYLYDIHEDKPHFYDNLCRQEALNDVVCIRPRMNNPRIIRQDGHFFLFGIAGEKKNCAKMPSAWIKDEMVIPARHKESILDELDTMDYNESFFYPGFEHLNNTIRKRYGRGGTR